MYYLLSSILEVDTLFFFYLIVYSSCLLLPLVIILTVKASHETTPSTSVWLAFEVWWLTRQSMSQQGESFSGRISPSLSQAEYLLSLSHAEYPPLFWLWFWLFFCDSFYLPRSTPLLSLNALCPHLPFLRIILQTASTLRYWQVFCHAHCH